MSQHDMVVANGPGLTFRTDMNGALAALVSQSSGSAAPTPTFPCQLWADTGTGRLKRRNSANTLWLDMGILDALGEIQTVASATLTDIGAATSTVVAISGTTTITGLGSIIAGVTRTVRFTGALLLTHNATSLILPGGASITTASNDSAEFLSLGSGNWLCLRYSPATGTYGRSNILGTVSQSSGVPTGSIIEYITNANGVCVKFADGTMICTKVFSGTYNVNNANGSVWYANLATQSFASTFIAAPVCSVSSVYGVGATMWGCGTLPSTTASGGLTIVSSTSFASAALTISLIAIGRWF